MPKPLINVSLLICERGMQEKDDIFSLIRIVDTFYFAQVPGVPIERQPVLLTIFGAVKIDSTERGVHTLELRLQRPDGEIKIIGDKSQQWVALPGKVPDAPIGFNLIAPIGVIVKQFGTHYVQLYMDGELIAQTPFTVAPPPQPQTVE